MTALRIRHIKENVAIALCALGTLFAVGMLFLIIGDIFIGALPSLSLQFLITPESSTHLGGGIANAIVGTILLSLLSTVLAVPCAIGTAIYLKRYAGESRVTHAIRFMIEVLSGTPSIVVGMFGLLVLVIYLQRVTGGFSLIAGVICLAILVIPVIERAVESAIDTVSPDLEEGSYALGATKWQTIKMVTLPAAVNGIMTSIILGFGRAAEESSVIVLTAGYSQFLPALGIDHNSKFLSGLQIHPFNDITASLPYAVYNAYENNNIIPMSNAYAIAFVLITFVLLVNVIAKIVCSRAIGGIDGGKSNFPQSVCGFIMDPFRKNKAKGTTSCTDEEMAFLTSPVVSHGPENIRLSEIPTTEPLTHSDFSYESDTTVLVTASPDPETLPKPPKKTFSLKAGINRLSHAFRQGIQVLIKKTGGKQMSGNTATVHDTTDAPGAASAGKPGNRGSLKGSIRPFISTFSPFLLFAALLIGLTLLLPSLSPVGQNGGPAGSLTVPIMAIVLCAIGTAFALFLIRHSSIFLLRRRKKQLGYRRAEFTAIALGICLVLIGAYIFSAHIFLPGAPIGSPVLGTSGEISMFGLFPASGSGGQSSILNTIQGMIQGNSLPLSRTGSGTNTTDTSNRSARLEALLASEETTAVPTTPAPGIVATTQSVAQGAPVAGITPPIVPVKYYLDVGESYWYGDDSRPCLATVYDVTELSHYFYWDFNWNRFTEVTPSSTGDTFLIVFIRIEDTGRMDAIVPAGDDFIVTNNGQTYTHNPFFDLSTLSQSQITHYSTDPQSVPYQWIREIGQQKRDYSFLTGYNIFGQNTTVVTNYTANSAASPPSASTGNGQGFFITPGSSNAIDGYLIYEVPDTVAADLKDTYVQVSFNSISPTRWRLGK
ncbi:MAG: phosphate ABC transporter permease PstA [Methanoregula sp.]